MSHTASAATVASHLIGERVTADAADRSYGGTMTGVVTAIRGYTRDRRHVIATIDSGHDIHITMGLVEGTRPRPAKPAALATAEISLPNGENMMMMTADEIGSWLNELYRQRNVLRNRDAGLRADR